MKPFRWSAEKNERLKSERDISFEEVVLAIEEGGLMDILVHLNYLGTEGTDGKA
ncbi:MAG: hypothetical protein HYY01_10315 [Chloroflexi bacterium]|nr:hypothetical protein [Chloroflexota bacterium]